MTEENKVSTFQKDIDQLTLEMFMNKQTYRRYVAKTDPKKHAEKEAYTEDLAKYGDQILAMTHAFLENPEESVTSEVNDVFEKYATVLIRHFKNKEVESANLYNQKEKDEDMLFGEMEENVGSVSKRSFWGKDKIVKKW